MRKWIKLEEVFGIIIVILLTVMGSLVTYILVKENVEIPEVPIEVREIIKSVETINITKIIVEEIVDVDGCLYARTPGHIKQCLDKYN